MADSKLPYQDPSVEDRSLASQTVARAGGVGGVVHREEVVIANAGANAALAEVLNAAPSAEYGLVTRNIPSGTQTVAGTVTANAGTNLNTSLLALEAGGNLAAAATSLAIMDDWDESDRAKVNPIVGQAGIQGDAGTVSANTTRVAIATDANAISGTVAVSAVGGTVTVSGTVTANAGTNLNTSLLALEAGGNLAAIAASASVLDDWDETNRAAVNTIAGQVGVQGASGAVTALTQRVVLATDVALPTGTNSIGQVTANAGTNLNTSALLTTAAHDAAFGTAGSADAQVRSVQGIAGGTALPVSAASLPLPTGAATLAEQQTQTASLSVMDDWDETDRAKVNIIAGQVGVAASTGTIDALTQRVVFGATSSSLSDGTANPNVQALAALSMTFDGSGWNRVSPTKPAPVYIIPPLKWSYHENSSSALTDASVKTAPGAGLSIYVTDIVCSTGAATAMNVFFEEGSTTVLGPYYLEAVAGRGVAISFATPKQITANTALTVTTSAAIAHGIDVTGFIAPA